MKITLAKGEKGLVKVVPVKAKSVTKRMMMMKRRKRKMRSLLNQHLKKRERNETERCSRCHETESRRPKTSTPFSLFTGNLSPANLLLN